MFRRMTFVCSVAMAAAVVFWFFGSGIAMLFAQQPEAEQAVWFGSAQVQHRGPLDMALDGYLPLAVEPGWPGDYWWDTANAGVLPALAAYGGFYRYVDTYRHVAPFGIKEPSKDTSVLEITEPAKGDIMVADPETFAK